jgi:hypothetical protein
MGRHGTKGTYQLGVEIDADLWAALKQFKESRKESYRQIVEMALRRHLANPPPPPPKLELPPLPPLVPPETPQKTAASARTKKKNRGK